MTDPAAPEAYWMGGRLALIHHEPTDPSAPSITESWLRGGQGPARFRHRYSAFDYYLIEGTMTFSVDGRDDLVALTAGRSLHVERGVTHTYVVGAEGARLLMISTPGYAWVDYLRALGVPATELTLPPASFVPTPMETVVRLARSNGLEFVGERLEGASREGGAPGGH